ncbi:hypothetical protein GCM10010353_61750 [Streptomyces chryseus]|uniref:Uncharacterized protein n=1 Tax=Streptomyces chryseus TaxID=68186 RepID=A0ABQ3DL07_9ACTN|nr:hypothetical protein GCM10010353_61750 [Streptomyces chryseus]GHA94918.1 hypothetical protein GCM10010346_17190 [Streptomyces chryseus]
MSTERPDPFVVAGERETLRSLLDFHRATLAMKCEGLSDEDLRKQAVPPSTLSLRRSSTRGASSARPSRWT